MLFYSVFDLPWWGYALVAAILTHVTIVAVTLFLHRHQAHRALDLHPALSHFFRLWLWLTTGMVTREWAANGAFTQYLDDVNKGSVTDNTLTSTTKFMFWASGWGIDGEHEIDYDDLKVRNYASPEPTWGD